MEYNEDDENIPLIEYKQKTPVVLLEDVKKGTIKD
jgi:hypothetical protein